MDSQVRVCNYLQRLFAPIYKIQNDLARSRQNACEKSHLGDGTSCPQFLKTFDCLFIVIKHFSKLTIIKKTFLVV